MKGNTYAAYSPYVKNLDEDASYTAVPIDMTGQTQDGNGSLTHIGNKYDYMYATASVPSNGNVNFAFNHVGSIIMLELTMPVAGTWTSASLTGTDNVFTTSATMDVSTGAVTSVSKSSSISLAFENVSTTAANQTITLYMSALPCTTGALTLKVKNSSGTEYTANLATKTLVAGHAYKWTASPAATIDNSLPSTAAAVDLGLSVKWANMNVGATTASDYGTYFAWGEVTGCQRKSSDGSCIAATMDGYPSSWTGSTNSNYVIGNSKSDYGTYSGCTTYKWGTYDNRNFTAYKYNVNSSYGAVDNRQTLESSDDAAVVNWGGDWRMPTHAEQEELYNNCYWVWTDSYNDSGINGYIVYKAKNTSDKGVKVYSGSTPSSSYSLSDNHIFLPCAGDRGSSSFNGVGSYGYYWSSSLYEGDSNFAWLHDFYSGNGGRSYGGRYCGHSARAVCP